MLKKWGVGLGANDDHAGLDVNEFSFTKREEDAQGTPTHSHISRSIRRYPWLHLQSDRLPQRDPPRAVHSSRHKWPGISQAGITPSRPAQVEKLTCHAISGWAHHKWSSTYGVEHHL